MVADVLGLAAFLLIIGGFAAALVLAAVRAPPRWLGVALAVALAFEAAWLVAYARGRDTYFDPDHVTRWEFAGTNGAGAQGIVVAAIPLSLAASVALGVALRRQSRGLLRAGATAALLAFVLVVLAAAVLSIGH